MSSKSIANKFSLKHFLNKTSLRCQHLKCNCNIVQRYSISLAGSSSSSVKFDLLLCITHSPPFQTESTSYSLCSNRHTYHIYASLFAHTFLSSFWPLCRIPATKRSKRVNLRPQLVFWITPGIWSSYVVVHLRAYSSILMHTDGRNLCRTFGHARQRCGWSVSDLSGTFIIFPEASQP